MRLRDHLRLKPFPATGPATDPTRAEFKLGRFPPDYHLPAVTPTQPTSPAK